MFRSAFSGARRARPSTGQTLVLAAATALGPLSIDLYLPAFPELAQELSASEAAVQLTLTACVLGLALGQLLAGPLSDAVGRRGPIAAGVGAWGLASFACAIAPSIYSFTALRFAQGLAGAAGVVVARAVMRDLSAGPDLVKAFSRLMLVVGIVPVIAPTVGGLLLPHMTWRGLFVLLGCLGLVFTGIVLTGLRESLPAHRRSSGLREAAAGYRVLLTDTWFLAAAGVAALTFTPLFVYVSNSSFVLREVFDLSPGEFGLVFGVNSVGLVLGNQVSGALAQRWPSRVMLPRALGLGGLSAVLLVIAGASGALGVVGVLGPLFALVFCVGAAMPVAASRAMDAHPQHAGTASALLACCSSPSAGCWRPWWGWPAARASSRWGPRWSRASPARWACS